MIILEHIPVEIESLRDEFQKVFGRAMDSYWSDTDGFDMPTFLQDALAKGFERWQLVNALIMCYGNAAGPLTYRLLVAHFQVSGEPQVFQLAKDALIAEVQYIKKED